MRNFFERTYNRKKHLLSNLSMAKRDKVLEDMNPINYFGASPCMIRIADIESELKSLKEKTDKIIETIDRSDLTAEERRLLSLRYVDGLSWSKISRKTKIRSCTELSFMVLSAIEKCA